VWRWWNHFHSLGLKVFSDGTGKRVKKLVYATNETTIFVCSGGKLVAEYSTTALRSRLCRPINTIRSTA